MAAAVLAPQVAVSVAGSERFPWTCAPMFAHHVRADEDLYAFRFLAETAEGRCTEIRWRDVGLQAKRSGRVFFARCYGSAEPWYPVHAIAGDTPEAFAGRLAAFLSGLHELAERRCPERVADATGILLVLDRIDPAGRKTGTRELGRWDRASGAFLHFPQTGRDAVPWTR